MEHGYKRVQRFNGSKVPFLAQVFRFSGSLVPFKPAGLHPDSGLKCLLLDFVNDFGLCWLNSLSAAVGFVHERVQRFKVGLWKVCDWWILVNDFGLCWLNFLSPAVGFVLFCLPKKVTKKGPPQSITPRLRVGSLIRLLHYCGFCICSLMTVWSSVWNRKGSKCSRVEGCRRLRIKGLTFKVRFWKGWWLLLLFKICESIFRYC